MIIAVNNKANLIDKFNVKKGGFKFFEFIVTVNYKFLSLTYYKRINLYPHLFDSHFSLVYFSGLKCTLACQIVHFTPKMHHNIRQSDNYGVAFSLFSTESDSKLGGQDDGQNHLAVILRE